MDIGRMEVLATTVWKEAFRVVLETIGEWDRVSAEHLDAINNEDSPSFRGGWGHGFGNPSDHDADLLHTTEGGIPVGQLQHYGVPTNALDVTFNPEIALWFATHRLISSDNKKVFYGKNQDQGVVFVLQPKGKVLSLREGTQIGMAGARAISQQGGLLLGATRDSPDVSHEVSKRLYVHGDLTLEFAATRKRWTQGRLFPSPQHDVYYRLLLEHKRKGGGALKEFLSFVTEYVGQPLWHRCKEWLQRFQ